MITIDGTIIETKDAYGNIIKNPESDLNLTFLGKDAKGFLYWLNPRDRYVYQQFPTGKEYWSHNHNQQGQMNGWICSEGVWDRTFHKLIVH
jgi:hypothetical protein